MILTGAGLSAESGLGTFRDRDGLWTRYDLSEVATHDGFRRNPALVHEFYNARRANCRAATPNAAHEALARLQRARPDRVALVTQNIDDLLERAGAPDVVHMHGEILTALCDACGHRWPAPPELWPETECPSCRRTAARPDVVWFGEIPYHMERIAELLEDADLFAAIGTSGTVYPAAQFVTEARAGGAATVEINLEPTELSRAFDRVLRGPASETVPRWVDEVLAS